MSRTETTDQRAQIAPATGSSPDSHRAKDEWPEQLAVKVARCYYELGMTQQDIAKQIGIGRARVIRLLAEARERGVVSIRINSPLLENVELGEALAEHYALQSAEVCLNYTDDEALVARHVGAAAGDLVLRHIRDNMTIGIGWGITLKELVDQLGDHPCKNVSVAALLGSLTRRSTMRRYEATTELAARLDAECLYLPAPIVCDSQHTRELLVTQPLFKDILQRALDADLAIVSIGGLGENATIRAIDLVDNEDVDSVVSQGAIGNFLGYYIDGQAQVVDHPINQRIIGIAGDVFRNIPRRIMVSAGLAKVGALQAVLEQGLVSDLVTDQTTARALLDS